MARSSIERAASGRILVAFWGFKNVFVLMPLDEGRYAIEKYQLPRCMYSMAIACWTPNESIWFTFEGLFVSYTGFEGLPVESRMRGFGAELALAKRLQKLSYDIRQKRQLLGNFLKTLKGFDENSIENLNLFYYFWKVS